MGRISTSPLLSYFLFRTFQRWLYHLTNSRDKWRHMILLCTHSSVSLEAVTHIAFEIKSWYQDWFSSVYNFLKKNILLCFLLSCVFVCLNIWNIFYFYIWFYFIHLHTLCFVFSHMSYEARLHSFIFYLFLLCYPKWSNLKAEQSQGFKLKQKEKKKAFAVPLVTHMTK